MRYLIRKRKLEDRPETVGRPAVGPSQRAVKQGQPWDLSCSHATRPAAAERHGLVGSGRLQSSGAHRRRRTPS